MKWPTVAIGDISSLLRNGMSIKQTPEAVRNYVLLGQPPEPQERLYTLHWRPMEQAFGQEACSGNEFSAFTRDVLTLKIAEVPRLDLVYEVFKQYERQPTVAEAGIERLLGDLHTFAIRHCRVALGQSRPPLRPTLQRPGSHRPGGSLLRTRDRQPLDLLHEISERARPGSRRHKGQVHRHLPGASPKPLPPTRCVRWQESAPPR